MNKKISYISNYFKFHYIYSEKPINIKIKKIII